MLGVQILAGTVLTVFYVSMAELTFDSIIHITRAVRYGELSRNMHATNASPFFFACYSYISCGMYYNIYHRPWTTMWMVSITLYIPLMVIVFPGYNLIWG